MVAIPGGVKFAGFVSPFDSADTYPVTDPLYGIGGVREVGNYDERDAISSERRRAGMLVTTQIDMKTWQLLPDLESWQLFNSGGGDGGSFEIAVNLTGGVYEAEFLASYVASQAYRLSENLTSSVGKCYAEPPINLNVTILKGTTVIGSVIITNNAVSFTLPEDVDFAAGDEVSFRSDTFAVFRNLTFTLRAER